MEDKKTDSNDIAPESSKTTLLVSRCKHCMFNIPGDIGMVAGKVEELLVTQGSVAIYEKGESKTWGMYL